MSRANDDDASTIRASIITCFSGTSSCSSSLRIFLMFGSISTTIILLVRASVDIEASGLLLLRFLNWVSISESVEKLISKITVESGIFFSSVIRISTASSSRDFIFVFGRIWTIFPSLCIPRPLFSRITSRAWSQGTLTSFRLMVPVTSSETRIF